MTGQAIEISGGFDYSPDADFYNTSELAERLADLEHQEDIQDPDAPLLDDDEIDELVALRALKDQIGDRWGRDDNVVLYEETYFREAYVQECATEMLGVSLDTWPLTCVDWSSAADDLQTDYTALEWCGVTFLYFA